jgi:hypothetical protein
VRRAAERAPSGIAVLSSTSIRLDRLVAIQRVDEIPSEVTERVVAVARQHREMNHSQCGLLVILAVL